MLLVVIAACLIFAGSRLMKSSGSKVKNHGLPQGQQRVWKCRADGCVTNLTPAEIDAQFSAGKIIYDPANLAVQLYECPKCRKQQLELTVIQIGGKSP